MRTHQYREDILRTCHCCHLSADDIFDSLRKIYPTIGRATIYRNIEQMFDEWLLRKIPGVHGKTYYERNDVSHAHLVDDKTKIFCDFPMKNVQVTNLPEGYELSEVCIFIKKKSV